ncbi:lysine-specific demethylase JMJ18-like isoform X1 [Nymphaea colorata]|nr:lysine-specific demethylase JMJ18-like isoform X1 [Nymphaea colorata]XP_031505288.1 lysine-specific demethylase JMJ18-like isoform X1 [Nymphaea colorata]XP_031505290.1 lysine-specific demethylase JMJ18-like isoform X1 [Nymphaea colorata]XP_031505292.1 lysine-specific demethylase JMJ18-like isoform X1 [Nymphaea colorata]XP_031505293.1 lysine-specific demethylase JMJ18-like isoform X1 [Nymphaea colorata]XP_049931259.1 lysine-specific demethylase JMJ18-like isoform X1 [Nymphaea colorata]
MGEKDFQEEVFLGWSPNEACKPIIDEAPVFYPSEEEFKDTLKYINSIYQQVEAYGICRIVPPNSFKPPCPLKDGNIWGKRKFETRIQEVDKLQNREPARKKPKTRNKRRKRRQSWTMVSRRRGHSARSEVNEPAASDDDDRFGFHPGPEYTLEAFQRYADNFKEQYFRVKDSCKDMYSSDHESKMKKELSVEDIEGEYWRLVEKASEEVEVHYGADLDTEKFCSGFPKANLTCKMDDDPYVSSGWNLNNFARLPGSVLAFEQTDISGVLVPWLYIGMCFSSFCWHVEDHHLYSLNYLHFGDQKLWYGVPGSDAKKLENAMKKHLPELFEEQPTLLNELVTQLSPSVLKSEGVSVYRTVQHAGEFVLTFPRAYHSGFNCGFNCAEAVNVAPVDWLPHGQSAVELYHEQCRKTSISHDKLLLGAANGAVKALWRLLLLKECNKESLRWESACGKDGILTEAVKARVQMEQMRREKLPKPFEARRMHANFDLTDDQECFLCFYDLHLSAIGCECSRNRFSCLEHAKLLCSCGPRKRYFLFRYDLDELHTLVKALEGNLTALYDWATGKLAIDGLSMTAPENSSCLKPEASCSSFTKSEETSFGTLATMQSEIAGKLELEVGLPHANCVKKIKRDLGELSVDSVATDGLSSEVENRKCNALKYPSKEGSTSSANSPKVLDMSEACKYEEIGCDTSGAFQSSSVENSHVASYPFNKLHIMNSLEFPSATSSDKLFQIGFVHQELNLGMLSHIKDDTSAVSGTKVNACKNFSNLGREGPLLKRKSDGFCISGEEDTNVHHDQKQQKLQSSSSSSTESDRSSPTYKVNEEQLSLSEDICLNSYLSSKCLSAPESDVSNAKGEKSLIAEIFIKLKEHHKTIDLAYSREEDSPCGEHVSMNANSSSLLIDGSLQEGACCKAEKLFGVNLQLLKPSSCESSDEVHTKETTSCTCTILNENKSNSTVAVCPASGSDTCTFHIEKTLHEPVPIEFGSIVPQKLWCSKEAIFPKGYKSRVMFFDILDPTQICSYISEVFDAGLLGPMFKVTVEDNPTEVFMHACPRKCWDLVRQRLNEEIEKLQSLGVQNLPPLQLLGNLDGLKMFGFSSLQIIESIEALDASQQCSDYWISKPYHLPSLNWNLNNEPEEQNDCLRTEITKKCDSSPISHAETEHAYSPSRTNWIQNSMGSEDDISDMKIRHVLRGLFKKGSREELILMHKVLCSESCSSSRQAALASLLEEIQDL